MTKKLSSTLEDYLEAILRLEKKKGTARVRDIAQQLTVAKSTVSAALRSLRDKELIDHAPYELAVLTPKGREKALTIVTNHDIISHFLQHVLLLDRDQAERIACEIEHAVDEQMMERLVCFLVFVENDGRDSLQQFHRLLCERTGEPNCRKLIQDYERTIETEIDTMSD